MSTLYTENPQLKELSHITDVGESIGYKKNEGVNVLYCEKIPVRYRHMNDTQDYVRFMTVCIKSVDNTSKYDSGISSVEKKPSLKFLKIQLYDDTDPVMLLHINIDSKTYDNFKEDQRFLVNFNQFPDMLIKLIENCCYENGDETNTSMVALLVCQCDERASNAVTSLNYREVLKLSAASCIQKPVKTATFCIIETNCYKELIHVSLPFVQSDMNALLSHIFTRILNYKAYNVCLKKEIEKLINLNKENVHQYKDTEKRLQTLEDDYSKKHISLSSDYKKNLETIRAQYERDLLDKEQTYTKKLSTAEEAWKKKEDILLSEKANNEAKIYELNKHTNEMIFKLETLTLELEESKKKLIFLSSVSQEKDSLAKKFEDIKNELEEKELSLNNLNKKMNTMSLKISQLEEEKELLEQSKTLYKTREVELQNSLNQSANELIKGNTLIQKLQEALKKEKNKSKQAIDAATEVLEAKSQTSLEELKKEYSARIEELESKIEAQNTVIRTKEEKISFLRHQAGQSEHTMELQRQTIERLNNQLNQKILESVIGNSTKVYPSSFSHTYKSPSQTSLANNAGLKTSSDSGCLSMFNLPSNHAALAANPQEAPKPTRLTQASAQMLLDIKTKKHSPMRVAQDTNPNFNKSYKDTEDVSDSSSLGLSTTTNDVDSGPRFGLKNPFET